MSATVLLDWQDDIAILTLNRPACQNTVDDVMARELFAALQSLDHHPTLRCLILRGAGASFTAGGDIRMYARLLEMSEERRHDAVMALMADMHGVIEAIYDLSVPVLASVEGMVAGFGLSLVAACDLVIAADDARFSPADTRLGVTPAGGCTWFLPRLLGMKTAMEILLLGQEFDARRARELGIVNQVSGTGGLAHETLALAQRLARGPRKVQAQLKRLLHDSANATLAVQLQAEAYHFIYGVENPEFVAGVRACLTGESPDFRPDGQ